MKHFTAQKYGVLTLLAAATLLSGCGSTMDRLSDVGKAPSQAKVDARVAPAQNTPVSMPMPEEKVVTRQANSLWAGNNRGFFKDQRAAEVGDIITVSIRVDDKAELQNDTSRSRASSEAAGVDALLGLETDNKIVDDLLPRNFDPTRMVDLGSTSSYAGSGEVDREEKVELQLAATVVQKLPNGNMVIKGSQEIRVNFENRIVELAGIIRPQDISVNNTIPYERIAEARIAYGGRGQITDVQQPRVGQQVTDILVPF
ncbi:MAG: flagellar basal body L-ring protein FlgH [Pseudomonadota bacterium]